MHDTFIVYIAMLVVILLLIMLAQWLKISYPIVLVVGGLLLGFIPGLPAIAIDPQLIFFIFLPPLLYEAAWQTSWKDFWRWRRVIGSFAFIIVILTSCVIAFVSNAIIPGFTLALGFLLGAIISPPDAVSATTILKDVKVPKRLVTIIEGESLLNDASSLIVFRFALLAVLSGTFVFHEAVTSFFLVIIMGILTGLAIAVVFYAAHRWLPTTPGIDTVLTFIAPYIMYITAEELHFSGVLAVVSGGLFLSTRSHHFLGHLSRMYAANVWSTVGLVLNGIIFMLIGLQLPSIVHQLGTTSLSDAIKYSLLITAVLIITRLLCTLGASLFTMVISKVITTADSRPGWRGPMVFGWAGMRGVVSLASALSVPVLLSNGAAFPQRNLVLFITFVVILVTLVFQGLTLPWVIGKMKLKEVDYPVSQHDQDLKVRGKITQASVQFLNDQYGQDLAANAMVRDLKARLENEIKFVDYFEEGGQPAASHTMLTRYKTIKLALLDYQRQLLHRINKKAEVDEVVIKKHLALLDLEEEKMSQQFDG